MVQDVLTWFAVPPPAASARPGDQTFAWLRIGPSRRRPQPPADPRRRAKSRRARARRRRVRTRERLVEAAKEIFEEHGFLDARITDISARAGQSHGSFYYYFDSKEEIFREVAAAVDERLFAPLDEVIMAQSAVAAAAACARGDATPLRELPAGGAHHGLDRARLALRSRRSTRCASPAIKRHTERVAETIRQLQRRKLADPKLDPMITAAALGALTYRFAEMWLVHGADRQHARARGRSGIAHLRERHRPQGSRGQGLIQSTAAPTPGDFAERELAIGRELARHPEHAFADHVGCHLGRAAADADRLAHQEVDAPLGEVAVVFGPGSARAPGELECDGRPACFGQAGEQTRDRRGLVRHACASRCLDRCAA